MTRAAITRAICTTRYSSLTFLHIYNIIWIWNIVSFDWFGASFSVAIFTIGEYLRAFLTYRRLCFGWSLLPFAKRALRLTLCLIFAEHEFLIMTLITFWCLKYSSEILPKNFLINLCLCYQAAIIFSKAAVLQINHDQKHNYCKDRQY